jgi:hypothetical protein
VWLAWLARLARLAQVARLAPLAQVARLARLVDRCAQQALALLQLAVQMARQKDLLLLQTAPSLWARLSLLHQVVHP